jgi:hypothetical protein
MCVPHVPCHSSYTRLALHAAARPLPSLARCWLDGACRRGLRLLPSIHRRPGAFRKYSEQKSVKPAAWPAHPLQLSVGMIQLYASDSMVSMLCGSVDSFRVVKVCTCGLPTWHGQPACNLQVWRLDVGPRTNYTIAAVMAALPNITGTNITTNSTGTFVFQTFSSASLVIQAPLASTRGYDGPVTHVNLTPTIRRPTTSDPQCAGVSPFSQYSVSGAAALPVTCVT